LTRIRVRIDCSPKVKNTLTLAVAIYRIQKPQGTFEEFLEGVFLNEPTAVDAKERAAAHMRRQEVKP
jgi:hypothetical protein